MRNLTPPISAPQRGQPFWQTEGQHHTEERSVEDIIVSKMSNLDAKLSHLDDQQSIMADQKSNLAAERDSLARSLSSIRGKPSPAIQRNASSPTPARAIAQVSAKVKVVPPAHWKGSFLHHELEGWILSATGYFVHADIFGALSVTRKR